MMAQVEHTTPTVKLNLKSSLYGYSDAYIF